MSASSYVHLDDVEIKRETDSAFLIVWEGDEYWIPKSQMADPDRYSEGDRDCNVSITEWIAGKKGIEAS